MIGGAPSEVEIMAIKYSAHGQLNRVKHKAKDVSRENYRAYYAGVIWVINSSLDASLDALGMEVEDDKALS